jgi:hypothetical protein
MDLQTLFYIIAILFMIVWIVIIVMIGVMIWSVYVNVKKAKESAVAKFISLVSGKGSVIAAAVMAKQVIKPFIESFFKKKNKPS